MSSSDYNLDSCKGEDGRLDVDKALEQIPLPPLGRGWWNPPSLRNTVTKNQRKAWKRNRRK